MSLQVSATQTAAKPSARHTSSNLGEDVAAQGPWRLPLEIILHEIVDRQLGILPLFATRLPKRSEPLSAIGQINHALRDAMLPCLWRVLICPDSGSASRLRNVMSYYVDPQGGRPPRMASPLASVDEIYCRGHIDVSDLTWLLHDHPECQPATLRWLVAPVLPPAFLLARLGSSLATLSLVNLQPHRDFLTNFAQLTSLASLDVSFPNEDSLVTADPVTMRRFQWLYPTLLARRKRDLAEAGWVECLKRGETAGGRCAEDGGTDDAQPQKKRKTEGRCEDKRGDPSATSDDKPGKRLPLRIGAPLSSLRVANCKLHGIFTDPTLVSLGAFERLEHLDVQVDRVDGLFPLALLSCRTTLQVLIFEFEPERGCQHTRPGETTHGWRLREDLPAIFDEHGGEKYACQIDALCRLFVIIGDGKMTALRKLVLRAERKPAEMEAFRQVHPLVEVIHHQLPIRSHRPEGPAHPRPGGLDSFEDDEDSDDDRSSYSSDEDAWLEDGLPSP